MPQDSRVPKDAAHGYIHGLRFYRYDPQKGLFGKIANPQEASVRHGYVVEDPKEFLRWCNDQCNNKKLGSDPNEDASRQAYEAFIKRVLRHQNRWMHMPAVNDAIQPPTESEGVGTWLARGTLNAFGTVTNFATSTTASANAWKFETVFGDNNVLAEFIRELWAPKNETDRKTNTTVTITDKDGKAVIPNWGGVMFDENDHRITPFISDKTCLFAQSLFNTRIINEANLADDILWEDIDKAYKDKPFTNAFVPNQE